MLSGIRKWCLFQNPQLLLRKLKKIALVKIDRENFSLLHFLCTQHRAPNIVEDFFANFPPSPRFLSFILCSVCMDVFRKVAGIWRQYLLLDGRFEWIKAILQFRVRWDFISTWKKSFVVVFSSSYFPLEFFIKQYFSIPFNSLLIIIQAKKISIRLPVYCLFVCWWFHFCDDFEVLEMLPP
jgi:hypothetical protein